MNKRAEQMAMEAYPKEEVRVWSGPFGKVELDRYTAERTGYQQGYEQAEKDLALTWEDMARIDEITMDVNNDYATDESKVYEREGFYEEVLKRFNEIKNGQ